MTASLVNLKAERECLAYAMQGSARDVIGMLKVTDLSDERHTAVFGAIKDALDTNLEITPVSVGEIMKRRGEFEIGGGITFIERLTESKVFDVDTAINAVRDFANRRRLKEEAENIIRMIDSGTADSQKLTSMLFDAAMNTENGENDETLSMPEVSAKWYDGILQIQKGIPQGYSCGIPTINEAIGGIRPGELIGITGAPGRGKSLWLLLIELLNALDEKTPVPSALYTLEMGATQVYNRAAVMRSDILNLSQLRGGPGVPLLTKEQMKEVAKIRTILDKAPLFIGDRFENLDRILADARRRIKRDGVKIVGIDYAQLLLEGTGISEAGELSKISRKCRRFAQRENVAVILLLKMKQTSSTQSLKGQTPDGDMVYGSGAFYYDANVLLWIHVDDPQFVCNCEKQAIIDPKSKDIRPRHTEEEEGMSCFDCGETIRKADTRLGRIRALKVRDGDAGAEAQIIMRGARMQIEETGRIIPELKQAATKDTKRKFRRSIADSLLEEEELAQEASA